MHGLHPINLSCGLPQQVPSLGQASTVAHDAAAPNTNEKNMYTINQLQVIILTSTNRVGNYQQLLL